MSTRVENWRSDPDIQLCKSAVQRHGAKVAILLWVDDAGLVSGASYGINRRFCDIGGKLLDSAVMDVELEAIDIKEFRP